MLKLIFKMAFRDFFMRKARTILTILGVAIGIATVVSLVSISTGTKAQMEKSLAGLADFMVSPSSNAFGTGSKMDYTYYLYIRGFPEVEAAAPYLEGILAVNNKLSLIIGLEPSIDAIHSSPIKEGRSINWSAKEAVAGYAAAQSLNLKVNMILHISKGPGYKGEDFKLVSILERTGGFIDGEIYIPLQYMQRIMKAEGKINGVIIKLKSPNLADSFKQRIKNNLPDLEVFSPGTIMENIGEVLSLLDSVLLAISGVSLLVGVTSVLSTMITNVIEKTREIGVMKAIGASRRQILAIFLFQSVIVCLIGGILGVFFSIGVSPFLEQQISLASGISFQAIYSPELVLGAIALSCLLGVASGFIPSWKAANIQPVEALKYE